MFNLFKKEASKDVVEKGGLGNKTTNEIIKEIHESFYTEVDRLLASAKVLNSLETDKNALIEKRKRLMSLGFQNTIEIKEAEKEIERLKALSRENESKKELEEAITYFSFKYPNYKFITEKSVKKICAKYNLIYGTIDKYIGSVPDKNLKHIEDFKIDENDECFIYEESYRGDITYVRFIDFDKHQKIKEREKKRSGRDMSYEDHRLIGDYNRLVITTKASLEIAAPLKDFNVDKMEVKDFKLSKIEIPDPVVLKPVFFKGIRYYLIVTAWGIEASDKLVVNERFN